MFIELSHSFCSMIGILSMRDSMSEPTAITQPGKTPHPVAATPAASTAAADKQQGNWFHRNRWFTREPITYLGYQFFRSTMATIPYGFAMAAVHRTMGALSVMGQRMGITPEGIAKISAEKSILNVEGNSAFFKAGTKAAIGRNLMRAANSPLNQALQIGAGFTLFRFTGGLIKGLRDKVMDEDNTPEITNRETKNWWQSIKQMARTNWPAESTATPIAALTLGFASANFRPNPAAAPRLMAGESWWQGVKRAVIRPDAKLLQNGAIWTIAYSIFFEASERIFKDMQLKRGKWLGHANSLKNADDPIVGGTTPNYVDTPIDVHEQPVPTKPKLDLLTGDPSICRFLLRRMAPVAVGITAYAALKRSAYLAVGGPMSFVDNAIIKKGFSANTTEFLKDAWREGAATAMFGALWTATDAWGNFYDKFFARLQDKTTHTPLTEQQSKNHDALLQRLNEKAAGHGRAA